MFQRICAQILNNPNISAIKSWPNSLINDNHYYARKLLLLSSSSSSSSSSLFSTKSMTSDIKNIDNNIERNNENKIKTGILMMNMGGPKTIDDVEPYLREIFLDNDIIKLPFQRWLGPFIAKRRTSKVAKKYEEIGGGSPLHEWTNRQSTELIKQLNNLRPNDGPYKYYIGFRYSPPTIFDAMKQIENDQVKHLIVFSQYAQYCCNTTGSSINQLAKYYQHHSSNRLPPYRMTFIDRWSLNDGLIDTFHDLIRNELKKFPTNDNRIMLLFTAHSLPLSSVNVGDTYPMEVSATVMGVMKKLSFKYPYRLVWQSKVGPVKWQAPATDDVLKAMILKGYNKILLIPISFINEHIETLHELDIELCKELIEEIELPSSMKHQKQQIQIERCPAPNDHQLFINGLMNEIVKYLDNNNNDDISQQLLLQCPLCEKSVCQNTKQWLYELKQYQQQQRKQH